MKKVLSLVLVIAMVLSSMSFAFAGTFTDVADTDYSKAIETLTALGVVTGYEDGTYRPEKVVTRAEMAKLMVEILGYGNLVSGSKSNFTDTQGHWADAWIALAAGKNIVVGDGNGKFRPDATVSYDEAITMIVRGLGYTDDANELARMTWPTNFKVKATELDIDDNVTLKAGGADRGGVAQLLYNALTAELVTVNADKDIVVSDKELLSRIATLDKDFEVTPETIDPEEKAYAGDKVDLEPYMYQNLQVYLNDDDEVVYVKKSNNLVLNGVLNGASDLTASSATIVVENAKEDDYSFKITTGSAFMVNGVEATQGDSVYNGENVKVTVVLDAANNDKLTNGYDVLGVVAEKQTKASQIDDEYVTGKSRIDVFSLPENDDDEVDLDNITVTGAVDSLEDIEKDDVVVEYKAVDGSKTKLVVSRETIEGKITREDATGTKTKYYINGKSYTKNALASVASITLGTEGTFFLDHNGRIVAFEGESGPSEYAVVLGVANGKTTSKFGSVSVKDYPQIKLVTADNEEVVYDVFVKLASDKTMSDSVEIDNVKVFEASKDGNTVYANDTAIDATAFTALQTANNLIKYSVDKDGRIDAIKVIGGSATFADKDDSKLVFADNAVVFDGRSGEDFAVVSKDRLQFPATARDIAYNADGEIEAMVTSNIKAGASATYAYIDKVNSAYNADGDKVQLVVAYLNGAKVEYLTDGNYFTVEDTAPNTVYALDLDGEVITGRTLATTTTAITVKSISTVTNSVADAAGNRYFLTEDCTILENSGSTNETEDIIDIYDVKDAAVTLYLNGDGEVVFIVK